MIIRKCAAILLFDSKKRILVQHRTDDAPTNAGNWSFFGGTMEDGETPDIAIKRECLEELNYNLENPKLIMIHGFKNELRHIFVERYDPSKGIELLEGQGMDWVKPDEFLKLNFIEGDEEIIDYIKDKY